MSAITFRHSPYLNAIQLKFTNGHSTEVFKTCQDPNGVGFNTVTIDPARKIKLVNAFVINGDNYISRLKMIDTNNMDVLDLTLEDKNNNGSWKTV